MNHEWRRDGKKLRRGPAMVACYRCGIIQEVLKIGHGNNFRSRYYSRDMKLLGTANPGCHPEGAEVQAEGQMSWQQRLMQDDD